MRELTVREMRQGYQAISAALSQDGEVVLTHHGKPYARVLPIVTLDKQQRLAQRAEQLAEFRKSLPFQSVPTEVLQREERDARAPGA